jgi:hypothetical protein
MAEKKKCQSNATARLRTSFAFTASQQSSRIVKLKGIAVANLTALYFNVVYLYLGEASGQCCQQ